MNETRVRQDEQDAEREVLPGNRAGSSSETRRKVIWKINLRTPRTNLLTLARASLTIFSKPQA